MKRQLNVTGGSAALSVLGALFCLWASQGTGRELCVTAGCALFQNFTIAGVSLWWAGFGAYVVLAVLALTGLTRLGFALSWLFLFCDALLLLLMSMTAPCFNCLVVGLLFFLTFRSFRKACADRGAWSQKKRPSLMVIFWCVLFIANAGIAVKAGMPLYDITDNDEDAATRVFFSPSCPSCAQAVAALSGKIDAAFYPVAEKDGDLAKVSRMLVLLDEGKSVKDALAGAADAPDLTLGESLSPSGLLLRFRLLRNKAYLFSSGSRVVPYIEYRGLPSFLREQPKAPAPAQRPSVSHAPSGGDPTLPFESSVAGSCHGGPDPCEDNGFSPRVKKN